MLLLFSGRRNTLDKVKNIIRVIFCFDLPEPFKISAIDNDYMNPDFRSILKQRSSPGKKATYKGSAVLAGGHIYDH